MMFSNSVVFLPPPTYVSWLMESLLIPFVHFIPVKKDLSDLEQMIAWADSHPDESRRIAERSTLFVYDLLFHPNALRDEELVLQGIMERYEQNFGLTSIRKLHPLPATFHSDNHPTYRSDRSPSVTKRVEYYMGSWFNRTGPIMEESKLDNFSDVVHVRELGDARLDVDLMFEDDTLSDCAAMGKAEIDKVVQHCMMAHPHLMNKVEGRLKGENAIALLDSTLKLMHFGNSLVTRSDVPVFVKRRSLGVHARGILWPFWDKHLYDLVTSGAVENADIPFDEKKQIVRWWGDTNMSDNNRVTEVMRTEAVKMLELRDTLDAHHHLEDVLSVKYLLCTSGIESSSSSKCSDDLMWMLLSQSIVMMPWPVDTTSWLMEDELEPFVHFIPIKSDLSNVEDMVKWSIEHPTESLTISERSTLYVHDMLFHPSAERDMSEVQFRMMEKYAYQFGVNYM